MKARETGALGEWMPEERVLGDHVRMGWFDKVVWDRTYSVTVTVTGAEQISSL